MALIQGERQVTITIGFKAGPSDMTDEQLALYLRGLGNVLWFLLAQSMAAVPHPAQPVSIVDVKIGSVLNADRH